MSKTINNVLRLKWNFPKPGGLEKLSLQVIEELCLKVIKNNAQIADVGCWTGMSSVLLGLIAKKFKSKVYAIDWFKGNPNTYLEDAAKRTNVKAILKKNLRRFGLSDTVEIIHKASDEASELFEDKTFDLVFIDANHHYLMVKKDIEMWSSKVKNNGILCGHDCEFVFNKANKDVFDPSNNMWNEIDIIRFHPGVVKAVSEKFSNANVKHGIWSIEIE